VRDSGGEEHATCAHSGAFAYVSPMSTRVVSFANRHALADALGHCVCEFARQSCDTSTARVSSPSTRQKFKFRTPSGTPARGGFGLFR
jgi:hypothetical protein